MVSDFSKKANREFFNNQLLFKTVGILFLISIVFLIIIDVKIYKKKKELESQVNSYQRRVDDIKKSSQTLKDEIVNSDNVDYLEKLGYEQFGQARPGETEYMFIKEDKIVETIMPSKNFWDIKSWFGWVGQSLGWIKSKF